jgi:hypothetical protein
MSITNNFLFKLKAHDELVDASRNLLELADWCDENFSDVGPSNEEVKFSAEKKISNKLYGGTTLKTTGQFAVQVETKQIRRCSERLSDLSTR